MLYREKEDPRTHREEEDGMRTERKRTNVYREEEDRTSTGRKENGYGEGQDKTSTEKRGRGVQGRRGQKQVQRKEDEGVQGEEDKPVYRKIEQIRTERKRTAPDLMGYNIYYKAYGRMFTNCPVIFIFRHIVSYNCNKS